ncbi:MAG: D-2-hydroxyacid dehydrogenase [Terrimicrobiaceae bacterium]
MKIVVLDGYATNPGDLPWSALEALGDCTIHDRTAPDEVLARAAGAEILLTNKTPLSAGTIANLPALRYIGVLATGYNVVDLAAARSRNVVVTNVPDYGSMSVAQHAFALLLELTNGVGLHSADVRAGGWSRSPDWSYRRQPLVELDGLTLGLIGCGRIGMAFARLCEAAGMKTISVTSRSGAPALADLLRTSDVISLHCPLVPETREILNKTTLALCKPSACVINTSRGPLVHEADLATALNEGRLAGAAMDVLSTEPPDAANPLLRAKNCIITPHLAWATAAARRRLLDTAVRNVGSFLRGQCQNVVG